MLGAARIAASRIRSSAGVSGWRWTATLLADRIGLPSLAWWQPRRVAPELLGEQVGEILRAWGMSEEHRRITVGHVLYADLHGIDSHGCSMLLDYHRRLLHGHLDMAPEIDVVHEGPATALLDGGGGLGHVPADRAMRLAVSKCREVGVAVVTVRNSGHFGAAGSYAALAAQDGLIGFATTSTATPAVVPSAGRDARLGTNPISVSAPATRNRPFLLDMATSTVPVGKLYEVWRSGGSLPDGWALDRSGRTVANARRAISLRRLTPLGGHKGYGLGTAVEILAAILPATDRRIAREGHVGHCFVAIDPARFGDPAGFCDGVDGLMDTLRASPPIDPRRPVSVAGDPEYEALGERSESGVPLSRAVVEDLRLVCHDSGAAFLLDEGA